MRRVKILTITLAIVLIAMVAFGGVYIQTLNRMENKVKKYEFGRELDSQRVVELKVSDTTSSEETTTDGEENKEENTETKELTVDDYIQAKNTFEKRLKNLKAEDYTISLNKENGVVRIELPENDMTDSYVYYLTVNQETKIAAKDTSETLISDDMVKSIHYSYSANQTSGAYQVYAEVQLTKDGQAKLNEILNDYALLATEIDEIESKTSTDDSSKDNTEETTTDENTETQTEENQATDSNNETTENLKKIANLSIAGTTYKVSKIDKDKITVKIGSETSNSTSLNNYISQAAEMSMIENSGKLPAKYEISTNRYEYSNITEKQVTNFMIVVGIALIITLIIYSIIYKKSGVLVAISYVGFAAILSLVIRYTNVMISADGISAIIIVLLINLKFNQEILSKTKKMNLVDEALKSTYKNVFSKLIPVMIFTIVFCLAKWESLSSFGMIMFWGLVVIALHNLIFTRTLLKLKQNN